MSILTVLTQGGWLMIPLLIFSVWGLYLFIERFIYYRKAHGEMENFQKEIDTIIRNGDKEKALQYCYQAKNPVAAVIRSGLKFSNISREAAMERVETAANRSVDRLQKPLSMLATISGIAPLTGFLGTVTGMIQAFMKIQELGGNVNATVLAGGIWEALITTAVGLVIGIFAIMGYNYLKHRLDELISLIEEISQDTLDYLI